MWIVIFLIFLVVLVYQWVKSEPFPGGSPVITGARGAGKTRLLCIKMVGAYNWDRFFWRFRKVPILNFFAPKYEPRMYSNIPLRLNRREWSYVLKREHVLMQEDLPKGARIFWDEIGASVNQYSHSDPNIMSDNYIDRFNCAEIFVRFYRHFIGENEGTFGCTDQATGDINIQFRRRFDKALQLEHFHRFLYVLPFYKVYVDELTISEGDVQNNKNVNMVKGEKRKYYFGWLPLFGVRHYSTHCYSEAYRTRSFVGTVPFDNWSDNPNGLQTNYMIDLRSTEEEQAKYNARKKMISKGLTVTK